MGIVTWKAPQIYASKNIEKYEVINVSMDIKDIWYIREDGKNSD